MRAILKHFSLLFFGILFMSAGVGLSRLAQLGTSPISSIPNVTSMITGFTLGQLTIVFMIVLIDPPDNSNYPSCNDVTHFKGQSSALYKPTPM